MQRPGRVLAVAVAVLLVAVAAATRLTPTPSSELLVGSSSETGKAGAVLEDSFGTEPIVVSVSGDLSRTLAAGNLLPLLDLEGRLSRLPGVRGVYGPATFINQTITQAERVINDELGALGRQVNAAKTEAERQRILGERAGEYRELLLRLGTVGLPSLDNADFVQQLVFGASVEPKQRFRWLFPDAEHAVILVRPEAGLSGDRALALGRAIDAQLRRTKLDGPKLQAAGLPLLAAALERETRNELLRLTPVALGAMLLLLLLVLRRRRGKLLSLAMAVAGTAIALGLSWPLGLGLTTATVAAMPVVLGLGLDFAVQLQARFWEERDRGLDAAAAAAAARAGVGPTLLLAGGAMAAGFLCLLVSEVPLLDRLGLVLTLGTACCLAVVLLAGPALLALLGRGEDRPLTLPVHDRVGRLGATPRVLGFVAGIALAGIAFSGASKLESDLTELSPGDLPELRDVQAVQRDLGTSGPVSVAVQADDVTDPAVIRYLARVGEQVAERAPALKPGPNLADLVTGNGANSDPTRAEIDELLGLLPKYFLDAVLRPDREVAELTFSIPFVSVAEQGRLVGVVDDALRDPPPGVTATTAGLVTAAAKSTESLEASRPDLLLLSALAVALVLLAVWRDWRRTLLVLSPALIAAGLASIVLLVLDVRLSPLGGALEPLVLAIGLEFALLLDMGYRQWRASGLAPEAAREATVRRIGGAVSLSATTVAVGFFALLASRLPLLQQLGVLVAFELLLCLVVAVLVVPAMAVRLERAGAPRPHHRSLQGA